MRCDLYSPCTRIASAAPTAPATRLSLLERRLAEPFLEPDLAESRLAQRNQRAFAEFGAEIARVRISDHLAGVVACGEALADQVVEPELWRTGHFNGAVHGSAHGHFGDRFRDVLSGH